MEHIMNNCIMSLLDYPGSTLLGINRLLTNKSFRARVVASIKDPVVKAFWVDEYNVWEDKFRKEAIAAIQNKVGQFLSASIIRNMLAQVKSTIDIRGIMDNRQILIMNLAKGRIGEDNSKLIGGMLITKIQLAAMERVDIPEKERQDYYLYVDEFQNFATESFANILSEARKYRLNLIVAHQYIEQLDEETVRPAIFGNVGTMIIYRVGAKDAEFMENEFMPTFTIQDLVNLTKFQIYLKLMIDGVSSNPFSANTLPPFALVTGNAEKVVKVSRERYAVPRAVIEEKVIKWSEPEEGDTAGEGDGDRPRKSNKPIYEATCSRCGKKFTVGFKFDPNRPIYCEDCLELVRSGAATPVRSTAPVIHSVALPLPPPTAAAVVPRSPEPAEGSHAEGPAAVFAVPPSAPAPSSYAERPVIRSVATPPPPVIRTVAPAAPAFVPRQAERPVVRIVAPAPVIRTVPQPQPQQLPPSISLSALKSPPPARPKPPELRKNLENDAKPPVG
jgi:CxxC-x17-CxxC domain-containing protein